MQSTLSMSRRTTGIVCVTKAMEAAKSAQRLVNNQTANTLGVIHAELFSVLRALRHQDIPQQAEVLNTLLARSVVLLTELNGIVQTISLATMPPDLTVLPLILTVVSSALTNLTQAAQATE